MKKMIFAMTIATGLLTAALANAQTPQKSAPKMSKQATAKTSDAPKTDGVPKTKQVHTATPQQAKEMTVPAAGTKASATKGNAKDVKAK